jgi:S1-C subfamily serine protease
MTRGPIAHAAGNNMRRLIISFTVIAAMAAVPGCATQPASVEPPSQNAMRAQPNAENGSQVGALSGRQISRHVLANTATLRAFDPAGNQIGLGSGFFIAGGRMITNAHVVAGAAWVEVSSIGGELLGTVPFAIGLDVDLDLAILAVPGARAEGLALAPRLPEVGDTVLAFGAPMGLEGSASQGIVSARREIEGQSFLQISAPISSGSSGGPVVNEQGQVVGVATKVLRDGQNLNFAVPIDALASVPFQDSQRLAFPSRERFSDAADDDLVDGLALLFAFYGANALEDGKQVSGTLSAQSVRIDDGPISVYRLGGHEGTRILIDVTSTEIDVVATLVSGEMLSDPDAAWTVTDDDGGQGTNARIHTTLPETGEYYVLVHSYDGRYGRYSIQARQVPRLHAGAEPERWWFVDNGADDASFYIDRRTLQRQGGNVTAWVLMESSEPKLLDGQMIDSAVTRYEFDCRAGRSRRLAYSYRLGSSNVLSGETAYRASWDSLRPSTVGESLKRSACAIR